MVKISIIIPVLNESTTVKETLLRLESSSGIEVIVVDGGSTDNTVEIVQKFAVKVISFPHVGRANQMNRGASEATGDILLFLHADTRLPIGYAPMVRKALSQPTIIAGAFKLKIDAPMRSLRWVETMVNWRSRFFSMPYGDQAIFLKTSTFQELGGFPTLSIMEDFELVRRLRRRGKVTILPASVLTSARRWQKLGIVKTTLINQVIIISYLLGVSPKTLASWYRGKKS